MRAEYYELMAFNVNLCKGFEIKTRLLGMYILRNYITHNASYCIHAYMHAVFWYNIRGASRFFS